MALIEKKRWLEGVEFGFSYIEWNTFAASHGKGAVDGVGAALKNMIWTKVRSENLNINSAQEYYHAALKYHKKTNIFFVGEAEVASNKQFLDSRFERCLKIECTDEGKKIGVASFHSFRKVDKCFIYASETSVSKRYKIQAVKLD